MSELHDVWREQSPTVWAESRYGWIGTNGKAITLHPWQRAVLDTWWEHRDEVSTLGISNIKKTGKTFLDAVLVAWRWLALPGLHFCVANDLDQAQARQFQEVADMCRRNPYLRENVRIKQSVLEYTPTGSILQALSGDATGNSGANQLTTSHTEAWGVIYEQDMRNWEELTVVPGKFHGLPALRIADSYAGHLDESNTWHNLVDRGLLGERVSDEWPIYKAGGLLLFHMAGTEAQERCFRGSPEEAAAYYAEQRLTLRENSYRRLHLNERTQSVGSFIDPEAWERLIDPQHQPLQPGAWQQVFIGLDLALAPGGDNCALIGLYGENGLTRVAFHKVWHGGRLRVKKLSIQNTVLPYILDLASKYHVAGVWFDPWQAQLLSEQLSAAGIPTYEVKQTHASRGEKDTRLFEMATNGELVLYDNAELKLAAANAAAKELPDGRLFLTKGGRGKIDLLVAMSNVCDVAAQAGSDYGLVSSIPNPFYGDFTEYDNPELRMTVINGRGYFVLANSPKVHPPGFDMQSCKYRQRAMGTDHACEGCLRMTLNSPEYQEELRQYTDQSFEPMSEEDFENQFLSKLGYTPEYFRQQEAYNVRKDELRRQALRKLAGKG